MMKIIFFVLFSIIIIINPTSPPEPEKPCIVIPEPAIMKSINNRAIIHPPFVAKKRLEENNADTIIEKSTVIVKFLENNKIEEHHQIIFRAENLPSGNIYSSKNFIISLDEGQHLENIKSFCEKLENSDDTPNNNICESSISKLDDFYIFLYTFKLFNNEHIIINYSYEIIKSVPEVLFRQESILIPDYSRGFCDYTFIIPEGYISLGLKENKLTKKYEDTYVYYNNCPGNALTETIRFTPKENIWKANIGLFSELSQGFTEKVQISFPKYYQGGKINESYYKIFPLTDEFKQSDIFFDDLYYQIKMSVANKKKIGLNIYTAFKNKLGEEFRVNLPETFYTIDEKHIDPTIKDKAQRILLDDEAYKGYPDYYKIGKFVNSYLGYNEKYASKVYTPIEIYYLKAGVSEHFTLLYNAMLNAIGIKTLYVEGWAFKKNDISGNNNTFKHTWTAAFIDGKWLELDATWDLFEGVSSGHILKSFFKDEVFYTFNEKEGIKPNCEQIYSIQMSNNMKDLEDPFIPEIIVNSYMNKNDNIQKNENDKTKNNETINYEEKKDHEKKNNVTENFDEIEKGNISAYNVSVTTNVIIIKEPGTDKKQDSNLNDIITENIKSIDKNNSDDITSVSQGNDKNQNGLLNEKNLNNEAKFENGSVFLLFLIFLYFF